jgi:general secretion pathway protein D
MFPASVLTVGAGFAYGAFWGTALVMPSSMVAAALLLQLSRTVARQAVTHRLGQSPRFAAIDAAIADRGFHVVLTLRFTPQITEGNLVRLNVLQEITDIAATSVGNVNEVGPTLTKRLVRNTVLAENGRTIVLGGLIGDNVQETITKTPLLGDIPGLGWLFKRKNLTSRKTNLLLFITPHIIRTSEDLAAMTRRSRDAMDRFRDEGLTPGWQIDLPPAKPLPAPAAAPAETGY